MITCAEAVRQLWDYLDGVIDEPDRKLIEEHLSFCRSCCGEVEFAKELRSFGRERRGRPAAGGSARLTATLDDLDGRDEDLLYQDETRALVREAYRSIDRGSRAVAEKLYSQEELEEISEARGGQCSLRRQHLRHARIAEATVLDLGCARGIDSLLAAPRTARPVA